MYGYIYLIINNVNGKTYVGKRKLYKKAWNEDGYMGSGKHLKLAQKKYSIDNFEKFLITWTYSEEDACEKEKFWIAHYRSLGKAEYNIGVGGQGGAAFKGHHHSEESKQKNRDSHLGKISANKGKKLTDEQRKKISESQKGKNNWSSEANKGRHWYNNGIDNIFTYECPEGFTLGRSPKVKETLSNSMKGRVPWNKRR